MLPELAYLRMSIINSFVDTMIKLPPSRLMCFGCFPHCGCLNM